jgi:ppGpp synthetase/RelA/SpoT-type nucleotidyltranferase
MWGGSMNPDQWRPHYDECLPVWDEFRSKLASLLQDILEPHIQGYSIASRIKSWPAIISQMTETGATALHDVTNPFNFRIVVGTADEVSFVLKLLKSSLSVDSVVEVRDAVISADHRYSKTSMTIRVGNTRTSLPEWARFDDLAAELQVLTLFASSWDALQQHLSYPSCASTSAAMIAQYGIRSVELLSSVVHRFEQLLDRPDVQEKRDIHPFLWTHQFILHPNPDRIWSEVQIGLGKEYQLDFLIREADGTYILVEIENPRHTLFTAGGDLTFAVSHAQRQVEDWQEWIEDNLPTVQRKFPGMTSPEGLVVIGRSRQLSSVAKSRLRRRNVNLRGRLRILTYDDLIGNASSWITALRRQIAT